ncbi:MAG TPA: hypothetical protein VGB04_03770 [Allosphingosinicella sp.]|jgi:hypothetical protein
MPSRIRDLAVVVTVLLSAQAAPAAAVTYTDNSFTSGWSTTLHHQAPATPAATASAVAAPPFSPSRRQLTHGYYNGMAMFARHLNSLQTYAPAGGQIANIRFRYGLRAHTINVGYAPMIEQGGQHYSRPFDSATTAAATVSHTLTANGFSLIRSNGTLDSSQHPDFSCTGAPITLGYYSGNSNPEGLPVTPIVSVSDLSNWEVEITTSPCGPSANLCCPPLSTAFVKDQLRLYQPGMVATNFSFFIVPAAPYSVQMPAYINYVRAMNPAATTLTVSWVITNQGTGVLPGGPAGPVVTTASTAWACTTPGCPPTPSPIGFTGLLLAPNTWYRVRATASLNGGLAFWPADCPPAMFEFNMREIP